VTPARGSDPYDDAPCGLLTTDANGKIERVNATFGDWLGYEPAEIVGRMRLPDLLTVGAKIFHQTHWWPLLEIQGSVAEVHFDLQRRDGHSLPVLVNARKRVEEGRTQHDLAVFVARERRKYEAELLIARKRAEELLKSERQAQNALSDALRSEEQAARLRATLAEQLVGIVSHDLRSPISAVLLGAGLLSTQGLPQPARVADRVLSAARRANRLLEDLLDFTQARLGTGLGVVRAAMDLHAVVGNAVEELRLVASPRPIEHVQIGDGAVEGDADRLAQVVANLVNNALAHGADDSRVVVTSEVAAGKLVIRVHNDGPPIPTELMPHVFEPMRRGERGTKLGSRSVGLGLFIVSEIARAHGGAVTVTSTAELGTTFALTAPVTP
jgi:sigma-B regulation protein RsbU (phosphoserine phosphatase)